MISKPKPEKQKKSKCNLSKSRRKILEKQIENILKMLIAWRDNQMCVMSEIDGARCGNGLMWNHYIAQKQSNWLRLELGNVYWGCGSHNMLDFRGDKTFSIWFISKFGLKSAEALQSVKIAQSGKKRTIPELEELLAHYDELYQNRFYVDTTFEGLIENGYYGEIIKQSYAVP